MPTSKSTKSKSAKSTKTKSTSSKTTKTTASPAPKKGLPIGAVIAIVIGSVVGGLALILGGFALVMFTATPAIQRGTRDVERISHVAQVATAITTYQSNNRGKMPTDWTSFQSKYLSDLKDPDGIKYTIKSCDYSAGTCKEIEKLDFSTDKRTIYIATGATCEDSETLVKSSSSRRFAVYIATETGNGYCFSN